MKTLKIKRNCDEYKIWRFNPVEISLTTAERLEEKPVEISLTTTAEKLEENQVEISLTTVENPEEKPSKNLSNDG